ncbi:DUF3383 domain-containing protein [Providencia sp. CRE-3FA-0001]|uniref:DUF3383 domain-containing protein n=2 Tax=Gammaproteobacteria TaxID=1236 RepID=A0AA42JXK8_9GAMM|nr:MULTISPECIES: DUF3383 domain-containing protein [Providencia]EJD6661563.1 DUF3383 domain-containing protein [Providencia rettgeri]ELR5078677.1 DUF3383 domain-containing protein [Providencia rettgeri]ELR5172638.1 DUF3383 domain-containing protein [Providencia rettgeri]ELR5195513.1 DUF3383 domain-containing protein [Providencia rettgeri]EMB8478784.1 DUF3383 domain-containing protein [Providencia rettgeri]
MPIKQTRYVDIASAVIGASAVPMRKLTARLFSTNPKIPTGKVLEFTSGQVDELLGIDAPEAHFARQYFSYVSPAPVSKPKELQIAAYEPVGRAPTLFGAKAAALVDLKIITDGTLSVTIGAVTKSYKDIDLSEAKSYSDIASTIQSKLNAESEPQFSSSYLTFNALESTFELSGGVQESASISVEYSALAEAMGLSSGTASEGNPAQTPLEAFIVAEQVSDSFGSATFLDEMPLEQAVALAQYISGENVKYQLHLNVSKNKVEDFSAALMGTASVGLNLKTDDSFFIQALPMAVMAATDYDRTNATTNYMFRQFSIAFPAQVTTDKDADRYDKLRVNYYGETAVAGSQIRFYQRGFLCGGPSNPLDMSVHANEQWLKAYIAQQWFSVLLATRGVPANKDGEARALMVIAGAVTKALDNGTILAGKTLTEVQTLAIADASGDDLAWYDVQDKGYWYNAQIVESTGENGLPEYVMKYVLIYGKGDWVRKVEGSHNLV